MSKRINFLPVQRLVTHVENVNDHMQSCRWKMWYQIDMYLSIIINNYLLLTHLNIFLNTEYE